MELYELTPPYPDFPRCHVPSTFHKTIRSYLLHLRSTNVPEGTEAHGLLHESAQLRGSRISVMYTDSNSEILSVFFTLPT